MKKLALIVGLLALFLTTPQKIDAVCTPMTLSCPAGKVACLGSGAARRCCDSDDECSAYQSNPDEFVASQRLMEVCEFAEDKKTECESCFKKDPPEAWTAIGCIPTTPEGFIKQFLGLGIGLAGGIAFLLIIFSGFQMITSTGNPERLNAGKELLTSAISGLILIIFSIFLLRLIGVDILGLPEFK